MKANTIRKNRFGVEVYFGRNEELGLDPTGYEWGAVCHSHGAVVAVETRKKAEYCSVNTWEFCEHCVDVEYYGVPLKITLLKDYGFTLFKEDFGF